MNGFDPTADTGPESEERQSEPKAGKRAMKSLDVRQFTVAADDDDIRVDRWFKRHMADVPFNVVSRWARTGQLRLDGKRVVPGDRILWHKIRFYGETVPAPIHKHSEFTGF